MNRLSICCRSAAFRFGLGALNVSRQLLTFNIAAPGICFSFKERLKMIILIFCICMQPRQVITLRPSKYLKVWYTSITFCVVIRLVDSGTVVCMAYSLTSLTLTQHIYGGEWTIIYCVVFRFIPSLFNSSWIMKKSSKILRWGASIGV